MKEINLTNFSKDHQVNFGTSGIRANNKALTDKVCYVYTLAFLQFLEQKEGLQQHNAIMLAGDLRANTDHLIRVIIEALTHKGYSFKYCGKIPTPALSYYCSQQQCPGMMVTGSHIPEYMNGIKFYKADGEILKEDEGHILKQSVLLNDLLFDDQGHLKKLSTHPIQVNEEAYQLFFKRYLNFFPYQALAGLRVGVYEHSSVASPILIDLLKSLGADVVAFGGVIQFYSLDTESISAKDQQLAKNAINDYQLDVVISTDGDGDRPLISDETGHFIRGDTIGMLTAILLKADYIITPISCNESVSELSHIKEVIRTRIGSPYVVDAILKLRSLERHHIIGYEANGGVLVGTDFIVNQRMLNALPTRDSVIAILSILAHCREHHMTLSSLVKTYCHRFTASGSLKEIPIEYSRHLLSQFQKNDHHQWIQQFFQTESSVKSINHFDGLRIYFINGDIIHLRPSGNAPELRCYTESSSELLAQQLNDSALHRISTWLETTMIPDIHSVAMK